MKKIAGLLAVGLVLTMALSACTPGGSNNNEVSNQSETTNVVEPKVPEKPKDIIVNQINSLLDGNESTINEYFGNSDVYVSDAVKDRVSVAKVTFISAGSVLKSVQEGEVIPKGEDVDIKDAPLNKEDTDSRAETEEPADSTKQTEITVDEFEGIQNGVIEVKLHICTMDYGKTKKAVSELTERIKSENPIMSEEELNKKITAEIASRAQNGEFDVHITMPVCVEYKDADGKILMTEAFKAALTGGWYNPTQSELISGVCPLREAAKQEADKQSENKEKQVENNSKETDSKEVAQ